MGLTPERVGVSLPHHVMSSGSTGHLLCGTAMKHRVASFPLSHASLMVLPLDSGNVMLPRLNGFLFCLLSFWGVRDGPREPKC